jgi:hypothetical protein
VRLSEVERVLDTYSLEDILELNDKTEAEVLQFLVNSDFLSLPEVLPVDVEDE